MVLLLNLLKTFFTFTANRQSNFLCSCYLGCHATFSYRYECLRDHPLVTAGKRSETLSKFNTNFFSMPTMFLYLLKSLQVLNLLSEAADFLFSL